MADGQAVSGISFGQVFSADLKISQMESPGIKNKTKLYLILITNNSPAEAVNAKLTNVLPAKVSYVSVTTSVGTCRFGNMASGASATGTITVTRTSTKTPMSTPP